MSDRPLFSPITIGGVQLDNRIMHLSTRTNLQREGMVTEELIAYYRERARGGVGAVVTEPLGASKVPGVAGGTFGRSNLGRQDAETVEGLRRLGRAIHDEGAAVFGQLFHGGRQHHADELPLLAGPSPVPCPYSGGVPHVMDVDEIEATTAAFVDTARSFQEADFDGVEVHGAQGHLVQQFVSGFSNRRTDRYGGSFENRLRFLLEVIEGIRTACGMQFVLGLRLPTSEQSPGGIEVEESARIAAQAVAAGVDYLSLSAGNFNTIASHIPDRSFPEAPFSDDAATVKGAVGDVPIVTCGRLVTPENADKVIRAGVADVVGLSRPLICDPDWPTKARKGQDENVRCCISCNQCWGEVIAGRPIRCVHNPVAGREHEWGADTLEMVDEPKRVVVVGGGPAGMEAARTAAARGHHVILFERARHLGGSVAAAATIPGHGEVGYVVDFLTESLRASPTEVRLGPAADVDAARVLDEMPDAVVIATGARHSADRLGAPVAFPVYTSLDVVRGDASLGHRCVLFDEDGYYEACETAELIAKRGVTLSVVTRFFEVGREVPNAPKISLLRELDERGVTLFPTSWLSRVEGREVHIANVHSGQEQSLGPADALVHVGGKCAADDLYYDLKGEVETVCRIGDAYMPRRIMDAVREGHQVGRWL